MKLKDKKKMFKEIRLLREGDILKLHDDIMQLNISQKILLEDIKTFKKLYIKNISYNQKLYNDLNKKKKKGYKISSFSLPSQISEKLCDFLDVPSGTTVSRTEITRQITTYIRNNNLQLPDKRRAFKPDEKLGNLLGPINAVDVDKGFTYFNLQKYISPHVQKL